MFKGIYTINRHKAELIDGEWVMGDLIDSIEKENEISYKPWRMQTEWTTDYAGLRLSTATIYISEYPYPSPGYFEPTNTTMWLAGTIPENAFYTGRTVGSDGFWTIRTRFNPGVSTRYIRSMCLGVSRTQQTSSITLSVPCIQETNEILDIFYRVFIGYDEIQASSGVSGRIVDVLAHNLIIANTTGSSGWRFDVLAYAPVRVAYDQLSYDLPGIKEVGASVSGTWVGQSRSTYSIRTFGEEGVFKHTISWGLPGATVFGETGILIRSWGVGVSQYRSITLPVDKGSTSSVQNTFARSADDGSYRLPWIDINNLSNSAAQVTITDPGTWAGAIDEPFIFQYRVEITTGGVTGVSGYRLRRRRLANLIRNSWTPGGIAMITMNNRDTQNATVDESTTNLTRTRHGQTSLHTTAAIHPYGIHAIASYPWPEFITIGAEGITITNVNGEWENVDADSTIPLPVTGVLQVDHDNATILVACENTGLWQITRTSKGPVTAITQITPAGITDATHCKGVQVHKGTGDWWAMFHDQVDSKLYMAKSVNQGATWTLYDETTSPQFLITNFTSGTPGPSSVIGMVVDSDHVDNRFCILTPDTPNTGDGRFTWWSEAGSSPTSNAVRTTSNDSRWNHGLGYKISGPFGIVAMDTGEWVVYAFTTASSSSGSGNALYSFGAVGPTADASDSTGRNCIGLGGPIKFKNLAGNDVMFGTLTSGPSNLSTIGNSWVGRTAAQYNTTTFDTLVSVNPGSSPVMDTSVSGVNTTLNDVYLYPTAHLGYGVFLFRQPNQNYFLVTHVPSGLVADDNDSPFFESFGWNGAAWELNHVGNRPTHATTEAMIDTLEITFDDAAGASPLITDEYYDIYVADGVILDDATSFSQTFQTYLGATERGTTFTPSIVPVADIGSVINEPLILGFNGTLAAIEGTTQGGTTMKYLGEPGKVFPIVSTFSDSNVPWAEQKFEGDFEVRYKVTTSLGARLSTGLGDWDNIVAGDPYSIGWTDTTKIRTHWSLVVTGIDSATGALTTQFGIFSGMFNNLTPLHTETFLDGSSDDEFTVRRVAGALTFLRNGVLFYTHVTSYVQDVRLLFYATGAINSGTIREAALDYTINRRYVDIGNGTTTGRANPQLRKMMVDGTVGTTDLQIFLDGTPAVILTDKTTAPGPGEVQALPSGRIWFNSADAGKTITGSWVIVKKMNT